MNTRKLRMNISINLDYRCYLHANFITTKYMSLSAILKYCLSDGINECLCERKRNYTSTNTGIVPSSVSTDSTFIKSADSKSAIALSNSADISNSCVFILITSSLLDLLFIYLDYRCATTILIKHYTLYQTYNLMNNKTYAYFSMRHLCVTLLNCAR